MHNFALTFLLATLYAAVPIVLAAMGGVISERSGIANIALEGFLLTGAFVGVLAGQHHPLLGMVAGVVAGGVLGFLHALFVQALRMDQIISGLALNLLAAGGTRFLALHFYSGGLQAETLLPQAPFLALAFALPLLLTYLLYRTRWGVELRAIGESPKSVRGLGIALEPRRYLAVALSGAFAATGGVFLSLASVGTFTSDMSAGKGYIALAAVIFGRWKPVPTALGALLFGLLYAVQTQIQIGGQTLKFLGVTWSSPLLLDCLPYVITIVALVSFAGRSVAPAGLGKVEE